MAGCCSASSRPRSARIGGGASSLARKAGGYSGSPSATKRTPSFRASASSRSTSSARGDADVAPRPALRASSGNASSAARAPPAWLTSARNVRGPTFSQRISRSQSKRCASLSRKSLALLTGPSRRCAIRRRAPAAGCWRECFIQSSAASTANTQPTGASPSANATSGAATLPASAGGRGIARQRRDREPDDGEGQRRRPGRGDQPADESRDALAALEPQPDRIEMAEKRPRRRRQPRRVVARQQNATR